MSDEKTSSGTPPTGTPPTGGAFDQEFEKFLSEETARVGAIYRRLPQAEPDAQLDARVRALARGGLRETSSPASSTTAVPALGGSTSGVSTPRDAPARTRRRWIPAFASAAVLVLAAGLAWRMGPQTWAQKEVAQSVAVDATTASNAGATAASASSSPASTTAQRTASTNPSGVAEAAKTGAITQPNPQDGANAPVPFPPAKPAPRFSSPAAVSGGSSQAELRQAEATRNAAAATQRPSESPAPTREKNAAANLDARGELKKSQVPAQPATTEDASALLAERAAPGAPVPDTAVPGTAAPSSPVVARPAPIGAEQPAHGAAKATSALPPPAAPPAPSPSGIAAEATSSPGMTRPVPEQAPADARRRDESVTGRPGQSAEGIADRSQQEKAKARSAASPRYAPPPPPPPPPMQASAPETGFTPEPSAAAPKPPESAAGTKEDAQKQAYDYYALPPGSPQANIPGRPTAAQLAAWPTPNCRAAGTVIASGPNINTRTWNYPPDVPDSAHLRLTIVKEYLDLDSREGALKAYADFRHCYPDDRWPESLLQRLGTQ